MRRTLMQQVLCYRNAGELARRVRYRAKNQPGRSPEELLAGLKARSPHVIAGSPAECIEKLKAYERAGVQEVMVQRLDLEDDEGLQLIAEEVLAQVA